MAVNDMSLAGKVCVVTGGNSGIGYETVRELAHRGATVALVARDAAKANAAAARIRDEHPSGHVDVLIADLSSLEAVRGLANAIHASYSRLDILVNNAGLMIDRRRLTPDGYETTFAVNYLAPFLLTHLLLDRLKESAPSRIVNVSSAAHTGGRLRWSDYEGAWSRGGWRAYNDSKLALIMFTFELARRLKGTGVTVNAVHPGVIASNFAQEQGNVSGLFFRWFKPFLLSPSKGAQTQLRVATDPALESVTGAYFANGRPRKAAARAYNELDALHLWDLTMRLVGEDEAMPQKSAGA